MTATEVTADRLISVESLLWSKDHDPEAYQKLLEESVQHLTQVGDLEAILDLYGFLSEYSRRDLATEKFSSGKVLALSQHLDQAQRRLNALRLEGYGATRRRLMKGVDLELQAAKTALDHLRRRELVGLWRVQRHLEQCLKLPAKAVTRRRYRLWRARGIFFWWHQF